MGEFAKTFRTPDKDLAPIHNLVIQHCTQTANIVTGTLSFLDDDDKELARYVYDKLTGQLTSITFYNDACIWPGNQIKNKQSIGTYDYFRMEVKS